MKTERKLAKNINKYIGLRLSYFRKKLGLRQKECAWRLGVTVVQFSLYETGKTIIPMDMILRFAVLYNCSCEDLLNPAEMDEMKKYVNDVDISGLEYGI